MAWDRGHRLCFSWSLPCAAALEAVAHPFPLRIADALSDSFVDGLFLVLVAFGYCFLALQGVLVADVHFVGPNSFRCCLSSFAGRIPQR